MKLKNINMFGSDIHGIHMPDLGMTFYVMKDIASAIKLKSHTAMKRYVHNRIRTARQIAECGVDIRGIDPRSMVIPWQLIDPNGNLPPSGGLVEFAHSALTKGWYKNLNNNLLHKIAEEPDPAYEAPEFRDDHHQPILGEKLNKAIAEYAQSDEHDVETPTETKVTEVKVIDTEVCGTVPYIPPAGENVKRRIIIIEEY